MTRIPWLTSRVKQKGIWYFESMQVDSVAIQGVFFREVCDLDPLMRR
jgi:hypothetical protein